MAYRSVEIANKFLYLALQENPRKGLTQMQLQKLVYFAHGWNWAINREQLISDRLEAWPYGPVYRELYDHTRLFGLEPIKRLLTPDDHPFEALNGINASPSAYSAETSERENEVIKRVWRKYGKMSGIDLSKITHLNGTPWTETILKKGKNSEIDNEILKKYYDDLAEKAQNSAA